MSELEVPRVEGHVWLAAMSGHVSSIRYFRQVPSSGLVQRWLDDDGVPHRGGAGIRIRHQRKVRVSRRAIPRELSQRHSIP
jgi:hypothetical protein